MARNRPSIFRSRVEPSLVDLSWTPVRTSMPAVLLAEHRVDHRVPGVVDLGVLLEPVLHDLRGPQGIAAMDQGDLGGEPGQEGGLLDGRVAAADDGDLLAPVEGAVAGGAGAHAVAAVGPFVAQPSGRGPRGDDQRRRPCTRGSSRWRGRRWGRRSSGPGTAGSRGRPRRRSPTASRRRTAGPACASAPSARAPGSPRGSRGSCRPRSSGSTAPPAPCPRRPGGPGWPGRVEGGGQTGRPRPDDDHGGMRIRHQFLESIRRVGPAVPSWRRSRRRIVHERRVSSTPAWRPDLQVSSSSAIDRHGEASDRPRPRMARRAPERIRAAKAEPAGDVT